MSWRSLVRIQPTDHSHLGVWNFELIHIDVNGHASNTTQESWKLFQLFLLSKTFIFHLHSSAPLLTRKPSTREAFRSTWGVGYCLDLYLLLSLWVNKKGSIWKQDGQIKMLLWSGRWPGTTPESHTVAHTHTFQGDRLSGSVPSEKREKSLLSPCLASSTTFNSPPFHHVVLNTRRPTYSHTQAQLECNLKASQEPVQ